MSLGRQIPPVEMADDALQSLTQEQRLSYAMQLVRDIDDPRCAHGLTRIASLAEATRNELLRAEFMKECG